ncbi:MAG: hypothetical protein OEL84_00020 [Nitrosopumilus sp.]|nr:hypothetical protein [Nitrosopumilus sp.]
MKPIKFTTKSSLMGNQIVKFKAAKNKVFVLTTIATLMEFVK